MQQLINFLIRNKNGLLFLILQLICFVLIYQSVSYNRSTILNSSNRVSGTMISWYHGLQEYSNLRHTNRALSEENARLHSLQKSSFFSLFTVTDSVVDSLYTQQYRFIDAQVVNSSYTHANNYITINKGSLHGIKKGMGIMNTSGVVGKVQDVSKHYATAIPLIHSRGNITGRLKKSGNFGPVSWNGLSYKAVHLDRIPRHAAFSIGDTVVTDVRSQIFPTGIPIGTISSFELNEETQFFRLEVELIQDYTRLEYVYVINDLLKEERSAFEEQSQDEE